MPTTISQRLTGLTLVVAFFCAAIVLLLSDRAGVAFGEVLDRAFSLGSRIERRTMVDLIDQRHIRGWLDEIGHAMFWGSGMLLVGWAARRRVSISASAFTLAGISLIFEIAQPLVSHSRALEPSDAAANLTGIAIAAAVLGAVAFGHGRTQR